MEKQLEAEKKESNLLIEITELKKKPVSFLEYLTKRSHANVERYLDMTNNMAEDTLKLWISYNEEVIGEETLSKKISK